MTLLRFPRQDKEMGSAKSLPKLHSLWIFNYALPRHHMPPGHIKGQLFIFILSSEVLSWACLHSLLSVHLAWRIQKSCFADLSLLPHPEFLLAIEKRTWKQPTHDTLFHVFSWLTSLILLNNTHLLDGPQLSVHLLKHIAIECEWLCATEVLILKVMVRCRASGRWLCHGGRALVNGTKHPLKEALKWPLFSAITYIHVRSSHYEPGSSSSQTPNLPVA